MRLPSVVLALTAAACGGHSHNELQVMSFSPQGAIDKVEAVEIRFDRPAIGEDLVGKPAAPGSIEITPHIAWKGFWQDRQTLVVEPTEALAPSTRYEVQLAGELGKRTAQFTFAFVHAPLAVEGVWGIPADSLPPDGDVPLSFNQAVRPDDAAQHCKLIGEHGDIALAAQAGPASNQLALHPAAKLDPGAAYTLTCVGLAGAGGNAPLAQPYTLAVRARPLLSVVKVEPNGQDIGADDVDITIQFSTPVSLDAARKAVASVPVIPQLARGTLSADGTAYKVTTSLDVATDYTIRVVGLVDTFGQKLTKPFEAAFHTGDASPRLSMERGIFALEASAKGYPLWSRNVATIDVECGQIPRDRVVQVVTTDMNYDAWGGNDTNKDIDWKALHVAKKASSIKTAGKNKWLLHDLDLGERCGSTSGARGVYLAEIHSDEVHDDNRWGWHQRDRVLANVTDLGVVLEAGTSSGIVWVTSLATGAPVDGAKVSVYTPNGKQVFVGTTDHDGLLKIPGSVQLKGNKPKSSEPEAEYDWDYYRAQRLVAVVEQGTDVAVVDGNWSNGIQTWNFGVPEDRSAGKTRIRGFIESDRGLYRPGEQVLFKGIVRELADATPPRVPTAKDVAIEVLDSRGAVVLDTKQKLSSFGGFAFDHELPAEATLGDYYVTATIADQTFREKFSVEEFRPTAFELGLKSTAANPKLGDRLAFDLDAKYLFGSPVDGAKVEWSVRKRRHVIKFPGFDEYTFSSNPHMFWWWEPRDDYGEFVADGTAETDKQGHARITARDASAPGAPEGSAAKAVDPLDYIVNASVTDATDQTLTKSAVVGVHPTDFYLGMHANECVQAVGMPFGVNLVAMAPDGKQVATKAHLSFIRDERACEWSSIGMRSYEHCDDHDKVAMERDIDLAATGSHTERIYPTEPGEYIVRVDAKDAGGRAVSAASIIWVIGKGDAFWSGDEGDRMTVVASKPTYRVGDTARLVAQANLKSPTALVTIERDGILDARVTKLASASEGLELPIADAWAPNVYARVTMVAGRHGDGDANRPQFKMGLVELKVASTHKQLDVAVALDRDHVRPGEPVTGKIVVTHDGQPVRAEVALSAADEGVLQLIAYATPNPMATFYASYGLGVDAATSWNRIARLADPESGDPDEGGDMRSKSNGQRVRSKFVASAFWAPMLVTDDHGEVAFHFTAPDNLTAFRLMAVAADTGDRFGAGERRLTVNKPLMAQPVLPRFLTSGDRAVVGVELHNHTDQAGMAVVIAKANGAVLDGTRQQVALAANGSARVRFTAKAAQNAAVTFSFAVALGSEKDAVDVTVPIEKPRAIEHATLAEQTLGDGEVWRGTVGSGSDIVRSDSSLAITVDRSGVGDLAPGLRALVEYPYGCLEQTMSRFVPLVAAKDLANTLDDSALQGTPIDRYIRIGAQKVMNHQQGDGLFSLWPQSQTYPHLAAYALWGLTVAQKAGVPVPADVFDRGIAGLEDWIKGKDAIQPDGSGATAAMAAYVMALRGKPDAALDAKLFAIRASLPKWGQAFLLRALALAKADKQQVGELEQLIAASIAVKDGVARVHESIPGEEYELYMTSDVRAAAITLAALLEVDPKSELIDPLAAGLKQARLGSGEWGTTQENVWSLVALAQYAKRVTPGTTTATVTVGGKVVAKRVIRGGDIAVVRVPLGGVGGDDVQVAVDHAAHVGVRATLARVDDGKPLSHGYTVDREYLDAKSASPIDHVRAGDIVTVKLTIHADAAHKWIALVDPMPAGFEALDAKLATGGDDAAARDDQPKNPWARYWGTGVLWDHQDMHDDRVAWFADFMQQGVYTVTYRARATIAGTFAAAPAHIEAMYQPGVNGRSEAKVVTVEN
jgi:uncharacterized protein YfaS (alpha-2-macroglobulin family)